MIRQKENTIGSNNNVTYLKLYENRKIEVFI